MVGKNITPKFWTHDAAYGKYLNHMSREVKTSRLVGHTIKTLLNIADICEIDPADVFDTLTPNEVIGLLRTRQISPCVLLHSQKFAKFYKNMASAEEKIIIGNIINTKYWSLRFKNEIRDVELIKKCVAELNI